MDIHNWIKKWSMIPEKNMKSVKSLYAAILMVLTGSFALMAPGVIQAQGMPEALSEVAGRAERTTERNLKLQTYYGTERNLN